MPEPLEQRIVTALRRAVDDSRDDDSGELASYIPELARVDPTPIGIAAAGVGGLIEEAGDSRVPFTIQSVSKAFVAAAAFDRLGLEAVAEHVGMEPSGEAFDAISLEGGRGRPKNPLINAGAIATTSFVSDGDADARSADVLGILNAFAGRELELDTAVRDSELQTSDRNIAMAHLLHAAGHLGAPVDIAIGVYVQQCSVLVTAVDLAVMSATLAGGGVNPVTGHRVVGEDAARWTIAVMASCGMYDASGEWLVRVGLPAKSGVGGGIAAVDPGWFGVGVYSPRLDSTGNSVRGVRMLRTLSERHGLHMLGHFAPARPGG
jgi:glutaminase